jgi:two-component system C4-dicarboxylate transport response regulator DctD
MSDPSPASPLVLIVEDDPAVRLALATRAELDGYAVLACDSAEAALQLSLPESRACLVIDERLPGLSGLAMLDRLRRRGCRLPAVIITSQPTRRQKAAAGAADAQVLEKPLIEDSLMRWIRRAVPI